MDPFICDRLNCSFSPRIGLLVPVIVPKKPEIKKKFIAKTDIEERYDVALLKFRELVADFTPKWHCCIHEPGRE